MLKQFQKHLKNSWMMNGILEDGTKTKQVTYLSLKKGKAKKLENYVSVRLFSISRKILENINKQKDCKPQQKR